MWQKLVAFEQDSYTMKQMVVIDVCGHYCTFQKLSHNSATITFTLYNSKFAVW